MDEDIRGQGQGRAVDGAVDYGPGNRCRVKNARLEHIHDLPPLDIITASWLRLDDSGHDYAAVLSGIGKQCTHRLLEGFDQDAVSRALISIAGLIDLFLQNLAAGQIGCAASRDHSLTQGASHRLRRTFR